MKEEEKTINISVRGSVYKGSRHAQVAKGSGERRAENIKTGLKLVKVKDVRTNEWEKQVREARSHR